MQNAARMFCLLAAVKAFGIVIMVRKPPPHVAVWIAWLAVGIVISIVIAIGMFRRAQWARAAGVIYAGLHALSVIAAPFLGIGVLVSGVIGIAALSFLIREEQT